jgi:hypothetical protein
MAEGMNSYSLADIAAMMRNNESDGFLNGNGILIILFFLIFGGGFGGGWGNGWGNGWNNAGVQGSLTRSDLFEGFNTSRIDTQLDNLTLEVNNDAHNLETSMLGGFNGTQREIMQNRFEGSQNTCGINRNIDQVRYENAQNTCSIINASNANTQKILDAMCEDRIQGLRDKIAEQSQMLQSAAFQVSQEQQNATLINALRPTPIPAYITASPYQSYAPYGYGNGNAYFGNGYYGFGYGFGP